MRKRANVIDVDFLWRFVAALFHLRAKTLFLIDGIVQLGKTVGNFHARRVDFKSFGQGWIVGFLLRKRRYISGKVVKNCRLDEFVFSDGLEEKPCPFAIG